MFQITIPAGSIKSVGVNPLDNGENPGTYDNTTPISFSTPGPISITPGAPLGQYAAHPVLQPNSSAAPGTYPVTGTFKAVAGGPDIVTTFNVIVPPNAATHLGFVEL